jgi:ribosomal-protein-alanine N-acetyltransferase
VSAAVLHTERLTLRPLGRGDAGALHALWSAPGVVRFLWDGKAIPFEQTEDILARSERLFAESGYGLWGAWARDGDQLVGFAGLWFFRDPPELELIYGVADDLCGQGIATEAAAAVLEHAIEELGMDVIRASTDAPNTASMHVLDKLGFRFVRRGRVNGLDTRFYELVVDTEPAEVPTPGELMQAPAPTCSKCGSEAIRSDSPAMRWTLVLGGGMAAIVLFRGFVEVAVMLVVTTVTLAAGVRARFHFRRCDRCGHEWHRSEERLES